MIEHAAEQIRTTLRAQYATRLGQVDSAANAADGVSLVLGAPRSADFFIAEPAVMPTLPACFILARATEPIVEMQTSQKDVWHEFDVAVLLAGTVEETVARMIWRHARAIENVLERDVVNARFYQRWVSSWTFDPVVESEAGMRRFITGAGVRYRLRERLSQTGTDA